MKILTKWLRAYLPGLPVDDAQLAEDLTLRGIAVEGIYRSRRRQRLALRDGHHHQPRGRDEPLRHRARGGGDLWADVAGAAISHCPKPRPAASPFRCRSRLRMRAGALRRACCAACTIGESRDWFAGAEVATYFELLEQKKISNAVDATNFAWLAMGQPTHAFDLDKIEGGIVVRRARKGERLKTLDGVERTARRGRPGGGRSQEGAGAGRRDGRLGHDDYAGDEECAGRGGVVRSHGSAANGAAARTAHRRQPPLRARRGLQRGAGGIGAGERDSAGERRMDRGRAGGRARGGRGRAHGAAQAGRARAERGAAHSGRDGGRRGNYRGDGRGRADGAGVRAQQPELAEPGRARQVRGRLRCRAGGWIWSARSI